MLLSCWNKYIQKAKSRNEVFFLFSCQKMSKLKLQSCRDSPLCFILGTTDSPIAAGTKKSKAKRGLGIYICNENISKVK